MHLNTSHTRRCLLGAVVAVSLATTVACASGNSNAKAGGTATNGTFTVLAILAESGALSQNGTLTVRGITAAVDQINSSGGILGRKVTLKVIDDQGDAIKAVTILQQQIIATKPDLVYAGTTSNEALAMLPVLSRNKIFAIGAAGSSKVNDPANYPYYFSLAGHEADYDNFLVAAFKEKGYRKIAILAANDALGTDKAKTYSKVFGDAGIEVVTQSYPADALDMTAQVDALKSAHADAMIFEAVGTTAPYVLKSRTKAGMTTPTYGDSSITADLAALVLPADLQNVSLATYKANVYVDPGQRTKAYADFLATMKASGPLQQAWTTFGWPRDTLFVFRSAARQANSTDPEALKAAYENLKPPASDDALVTWPSVRFSPTDHQTASDARAYSLVPIGARVDGTWKETGP